MLVWIILIIFAAAVLVALGVSRLNIPRDISREGVDNHDSILAYDKISQGPLFILIRYMVIRQLKRYHPHGLLVDAGCGPGYLTFSIARIFPKLKILGIDISKDTLELASKNRSARKFDSRVNFEEADVVNLPVDSNSIDFAVSTLSLHHWPQPDKALLEIHRVLKPEGQMLLFDLRRDTPRLLFYAVRFNQRFFAPSPIRHLNGGVGSVWSSLTPGEIESLPSLSLFSDWKVQKRWGWVYIWGRK